MSKGLVPVDSERFGLMEKIVDLKTEGTNDTEIARRLGIKRVEVKDIYQEWKDTLAHDREAVERARDVLNLMDEHYNRIIQKSYILLKELETLSFTHNVAAQINATLKNIAEYEAKRLDAWNKAGLMDGADLGDEMAAMEEKHQILISILRNDLCKDCQRTVAEKLAVVTGQVEVVQG